MGKKTQEKALTLKQENFCQYYVDTEGNASEAYRMAYNAQSMKPETVWSNACRLKADSKVSARIQEIIDERAKASVMTRAKVEKVLFDIVTADPMELYIVDEKTGKVKLKSPHQLSKRVRNALKKMQNKRGEVTYEFNGKTEAARLLGAWNGWEPPKVVDVKTDGGKIGELRIGFDED